MRTNHRPLAHAACLIFSIAALTGCASTGGGTADTRHDATSTDPAVERAPVDSTVAIEAPIGIPISASTKAPGSTALYENRTITEVIGGLSNDAGENLDELAYIYFEPEEDQSVYEELWISFHTNEPPASEYDDIHRVRTSLQARNVVAFERNQEQWFNEGLERGRAAGWVAYQYPAGTYQYPLIFATKPVSSHTDFRTMRILVHRKPQASSGPEDTERYIFEYHIKNQ